MYIVPHVGSELTEPSGGKSKLLTVGAFSKYDF